MVKSDDHFEEVMRMEKEFLFALSPKPYDPVFLVHKDDEVKK